MELHTETSGWSHPWNPDSLEWYLDTGLSAESLLKEKWLVNHTAVDYPFAVFDNEGKKWMRAPFAANEDGSITFATRMAVGNTLFK